MIRRVAEVGPQNLVVLVELLFLQVFLESLVGEVKEPVHLMGVGPTGEPNMWCDDPELDQVEQVELHLIRSGLELTKSKI